jgi:hypothetical protein
MHRLNGVLVEDLEKKRAIWRLRRGWEDNIKMDLKELECEDKAWT